MMTKLKTIQHTKKFIKNFKRYNYLVSAEMVDVLYHLIHRLPVPVRYRNHELQGELAGVWDCHLKFDLLLLYEIDEHSITLYGLGTHSELFG